MGEGVSPTARQRAIKSVIIVLGLALLLIYVAHHFARLPACAARMADSDRKVLASDEELYKLSSATPGSRCRYYRQRFELMSQAAILTRECGSAKQAERIAFEARAYEKLSGECARY